MRDPLQFNKRTFLVSFLFPYLFILLLPLLIGWIIYFKSLGVITDEISRADEAILKQIQQSIDSRLRDVELLTTRISMDARIKALMNSRSEVSTLQRYANYGLLKELNTYQISNRFLGRFYIYFHQPDLILSTKGTFKHDAFFKQFFANYVMNDQEWQAYIQGYHPNEYLPLIVKDQDGKVHDRTLVYAKSIFPYVSNNPDDSLAAIFIHLDNSVFDSILNQIERGDGRTISIVNSRSQLLYTTDREGGNDQPIRFDDLSAGGVTHMELNGEQVIVSSIRSEMTDWQYVSVIPTGLFMHKAEVVRNWATFGLMFIILLGGILALLFSRKNYGPIRKLLRVISEKSGVSPKMRYNEYKFIEETVSHIVLEKQRLEEKQRRQNLTLRDHFLVRLMKGNQGNGLSVQDLYDTYNIRLKSDQFAILLFYLDDISRFCHEPAHDKTRDEELVHFIIKNIVEDYVRKQNHNGFVVEVDQFLVCLVNFKDKDQTKQKNEVMEIAEHAIQLFEKRFGIICSVAISTVYSRLQDIKLAYEEAIQAIEYKLVVGGKSIIRYTDIQANKQEVTNYGFSAAKEYQFVNCIKAGDYQSAKQMISDIIVKNSTQVPLMIVKCNMFALIHMVMNSLSSISVILEKEFIENLNPVDRLLGCKTLPQLEKEIFSILDRIEQYVDGEDRRNKSVLIDEIIVFSQRNYQNADFNVSMIADHFHVSLPYISKVFKQHTGEGLLEYIQKIRMHKAKEMLTAHDITIKEVAALVGYENRDTFIRLFKKYEGVTPGKFKG